ncbi:MAG: LAGLIDADG family homing endonuclease [Candidatus Woesearchaeota archaeon]
MARASLDKVQIAELCGIILGDGHVHKEANRITITGSLNDKDYHRKIVAQLFMANFSVKPIYFEQREKNAHYIQVESKQLLGYFLSLGLKRAAKINPEIPIFIFNNPLYMSCFIRGLFDTDGCLKFSKMTSELAYYPRIRIAAKESKMAREIGLLLDKLGFNFSLWKDKRARNTIFVYEISGKDNLAKWFRIIQPKNPNKINKYKIWKKFGYYKEGLALNS